MIQAADFTIEDYDEEARRILNNQEYCESIDVDPFPELRKKFSRLIQEASDWQIINKEEVKIICITHPNTPLFYYLP